MVQTVKRCQLKGGFPQKLGGGGLRFEIQMMVFKSGVKTFANEEFEGV